MTRDEKETSGAATPKVTVNIPCEKLYTPEEVDELLKSITAGVKRLAVSRGTRIDARSRVAEAEAALNEARLKAKMDDLIVAQEEFNRAFSQGRQSAPLVPLGQTASDLKLEKSESGHRLRRWLESAARQGLRFVRIRKQRTAE